MVLLSAALHASWNFGARKVSGNLSVMWLGMWGACLFCLPVLLIFPVTMTALRSAWPWVAATGLVHALYFLLLSRAYEEGEISLVYPIARGTGVAGTAVAANLLVNESLSVLGIAGVIAVSMGIVLLGFRDLLARATYRSALYALLVGGTIIIYSIVDKQGVGRLHPVAYIYAMFLIPAVLLAPYILVRQRQAAADAWQNRKGYIALIGPGSMATYLIVLFAFQMGKVSYVVAVREFSVVIGSALGVMLLGERLTPWKVLGVVFISLGLVLVKMAV